MRASTIPVAPAELQAFLRLGPSLLAATCDDRMVVELSRCAAAELDDEGSVRVAVPLPEGQRTLANIDCTRVVALSAASPADYRTVQMKGTDARRVEWPLLQRMASEHLARFERNLLNVGLPESYVTRLISRDYVAIIFTPSELYDQTPGPNAGLALKP